MPFYSIKNWDRLFETAETRKYKNLKWVPVPNKHDGKSLGYLKQHEKKVEIFCAWNLILQLASKMPHRGILVDSDNEPLTSEDMAIKTGFPEEIFTLALKVLISPKIGWIVQSAATPGDAPAIAEDSPATSGLN